MAVEYVGTGNDDGVVLGRSATDKVGFYNATPVVQPTATVLAALTAGETTPADIAAALVELRDVLETLGLLPA
jgi:hypothetical protein